MSVGTHTVAISRRYFMRKTRADLRAHILQLVSILGLQDYDKPRLWAWTDKADLAREAIRLHALLPDDQP